MRSALVRSGCDQARSPSSVMMTASDSPAARKVRSSLSITGKPNAEKLEAQLQAWVGEGPIAGVYWLAALDREVAIGELAPKAWTDAINRRAKLLYTTMRTLYDRVSERGTFLVTGTRLGGKHGFDPQSQQEGAQ